MNKVTISAELHISDSAGSTLVNAKVSVDLEEVQFATFPQIRGTPVIGSKSGTKVYSIGVFIKGRENPLELLFATLEAANTAWRLVSGEQPIVSPLSAHYTVRYNGSLQLASGMRHLLILNGMDCSLVADVSLPVNTNLLELNGRQMASNMEELVKYLRGLGVDI